MNVKSKDKASISYVLEGYVGAKTKDAEETDVDTGVFQYKLKTSEILLDYGLKFPDDLKELVGKRISIVYRDSYDEAGKAVTLSTVISIISVDPVISFDKTYYNVGDTAKITVGYGC